MKPHPDQLFDKWKSRPVSETDHNIIAAQEYHDDFGDGDLVLPWVYGDGALCVWVTNYERANQIVVFVDSTYRADDPEDEKRARFEVETKLGIDLSVYGCDVTVVDQSGYDFPADLAL